jgi:ATP-dependent DNA ligase
MLTKMRIRCPDKPIRIASDVLCDFDSEDQWIATVKYDGWRCIIDYDGENVEFFSRRDVDSGGPTIHPMDESLKAEVLSFLKENEWIGKEPEDVRWELVSTYIYNQPHVKLAENTREDFSEFFAKVKARDTALPEKQWKVEGIVIKHRNSRYMGNVHSGAKNPRWFKVKWRDGASGKIATF